MTTNRSLWLSLQKRCPGNHEHCECRGKVAQASAYYPKMMVTAVVKAIKGHWEQIEETQGIGLVADAENYLLNIEQATEDENGGTVNRALREENPGLFALTRNRFPAEPPTGKKLEAIRQQMLRIHRASGHAPFSRLQKLLAVRKAPK